MNYQVIPSGRWAFVLVKLNVISKIKYKFTQSIHVNAYKCPSFLQMLTRLTQALTWMTQTAIAKTFNPFSLLEDNYKYNFTYNRLTKK